uniref:Copper(I)-binding protein n=1 Tax=Candidatus Kentrum sp. TUN TaxID=2126343 RepID=A0A450ZIM1_9GAMM|nr:MAG: hypothetical protein BECKTUN1418D_GA0071000_101827 [Candidatus Kentron sp. TUN]
MRTIAIFLLLIIETTVWAEANVTITDPWIREAPPGVRALAGYLVLHNHGDTDISLVSASGPDFNTVMLHETITRSEMATMVHLDQIGIPARREVTFKPGGMHLMLMQPKKTFVAGDRSTIILVFADGTEVSTKFKVKRPFANDGKINRKHH